MLLPSAAHIQLAAKLAYDATQIPVFYIEIAPNPESSWSYTSTYTSNPDKSSLPRDWINQLLAMPVTKKIHLAYINRQADKIILIPVQTTDGEGRLLLWPSSRKFLDTNLLNQQLESSATYPHDTTQLLSAAVLIYYLLYHEALSLEQVIEENQNMLNSKTDDVLELRLVSPRENSLFHKSYLAEKKILEQIRLGNKKKMLLYLKQHTDMRGVYGTLSKNDSLRSKKNLIISAITLATRSAIEGGLYSELAFTMSDDYIQYVEHVPRIDTIHPLLEDILVDFTDRVEKVQRAHFSKDILLCQEYIFDHLYDDLDLCGLADYLKMSPSHLSRKFKDETGEGLKSFIQKQRVEEAKNLIVFSDYSLSEIYSLLNFHDQSYFIKVFKKYTGYTPKEYRNRFVVKPS